MSNPILSEDNWNLVSVTIDRDQNIKMYVNATMILDE